MAMCMPLPRPCGTWAWPRSLPPSPAAKRDLVLAMVGSRIVAPHTKLAATRWWHTTTLAEDFGVTEASEDHLYAPMDWLLAAPAHNPEEARCTPAERRQTGVVRDLSSSYFEGRTCPLAKPRRMHRLLRWPQRPSLIWSPKNGRHEVC